MRIYYKLLLLLIIGLIAVGGLLLFLSRRSATLDQNKIIATYVTSNAGIIFDKFSERDITILEEYVPIVIKKVRERNNIVEYQGTYLFTSSSNKYSDSIVILTVQLKQNIITAENEIIGAFFGFIKRKADTPVKDQILSIKEKLLNDIEFNSKLVMVHFSGLSNSHEAQDL